MALIPLRHRFEKAVLPILMVLLTEAAQVHHPDAVKKLEHLKHEKPHKSESPDEHEDPHGNRTERNETRLRRAERLSESMRTACQRSGDDSRPTEPEPEHEGYGAPLSRFLRRKTQKVLGGLPFGLA